jgi:hypothetical protein
MKTRARGPLYVMNEQICWPVIDIESSDDDIPMLYSYFYKAQPTHDKVVQFSNYLAQTLQ